MKRIKIMLMSLAVLAVVGGALAFNVKFNDRICSVDPNATNICTNGSGGDIACPNLLPAGRTTDSEPNLGMKCYTIVAAGQSCTGKRCQLTSTSLTNVEID